MKKINIFILTFFILILSANMAFAEEASTLTLNDAYQKAINYSPTLKNAQMEIEKAQITFDDVSDNIRYTPIDISYAPGDQNLFKSFYGADFNKRKAEKDYENSKRSLLIDVKKAYYNVVSAKEKIDAIEKLRNQNQLSLLQANEKFKVGLITDTQLEQVKTSVANANSQLFDAKSNLDNAYSELNKLFGATVTDREELTDLPKVEKQDIDTDMQVNMAVANSYEIWSATESAKLSDQIKYFQKYYDYGDYQASQAENTLSDAKKAISTQTRELCNSINYLYEKNEELNQQKTLCQKALKVQQALWNAGMSTKDAVVKAQYDLSSCEEGQTEVAAAYEVSVDTLKRLVGKSPNEQFAQ